MSDWTPEDALAEAKSLLSQAEHAQSFVVDRHVYEAIDHIIIHANALVEMLGALIEYERDAGYERMERYR